MCEIAIINGTLGVGKTETSWEIMDLIQPAALIDIDYLYAFKPKDYANAAQQTHVYEAVDLLINHHQKLNIQRFIINGVFETPVDLSRLWTLLNHTTRKINAYRLICEQDVIQQRIKNRNEPHWQTHIGRSKQLANIQTASAKTGNIGENINTTILTLNEAAKMIIKDMQSCGFWSELTCLK